MLESLNNNLCAYEKLSEEEQTKRGILGRLVGIIADSENPTRNGRLYSKQLWENVFNDPIMKEKIENRCCFGELGHPADREEVDPEKIAICLAEQPKVNDKGQLCGVFDILSTPCGKILKTLCDYGCTIGVSSRGTGDIMSNDEVNPETYSCECWDAVLIPAVKTARMKFVTESLDTHSKTMRQALTESYNAATDEDKKIMKEALEDLEINIEEDSKKELIETQLTADDIEYEDPEASDVLVEEDEAEEIEEPIEVDTEEIPVEVPEASEETEVSIEEEPVEEKPIEIPAEEVADAIEDVVDGIKEIVEPSEKEEEAIDEVVEDKIEELLPEEESKDEESEEINNEQPEVEETAGEDIEAESNEEAIPEDENSDKEEAEDNGSENWVESLKEMVRQKDLLLAEIKKLKEAQTVSDAEVSTLKEELNKYKTGFARVSELASKSSKFKKEVQNLIEQLNQRDVEIKNLQSKIVNSTQLTESVNAHKQKVSSLTEQLNVIQKELTESENKLNEQRVTYSKKLNEAVAIAKEYKAQYTAVLEHYINSKASMLGVRPADITKKLNENYSINDIDAVCEELLETPNHFSSSLFSNFGVGTKVKIHESKSNGNTTPKNDDDLSDLLELAGLK